MKFLRKYLLLAIATLWLSYQSFSQQKDASYQLNVTDSGFIFPIGPHDACLFIPSAETEIEGLFRSKDPVFYMAVQLKHMSVDNYNKLVQQQHTLKVDFKGGDYSRDSVEYARVYLKLEISTSQIIQKGRRTKYYLQSILGKKHLYCFTKTDIEFLEGRELLEVL